MMRSEAASCTENRPCLHYDPCAKCAASLYLTEEDWFLLDFYRRVADQVIVPGMGGESMPRLEGYEAVLRIHDYPAHLYGWLCAGASMIHRLLQKTDQVSWTQECGKPYREIGPEDVC